MSTNEKNAEKTPETMQIIFVMQYGNKYFISNEKIKTIKHFTNSY